MRASLALVLLVAGCSGGGEATWNTASEPTNAVSPVNQVAPEPAPANQATAPGPALAPPADDPGLAAMSPYRRREYERGWRDCMTGDFDRERQGESYRIGCMAAEEAKEAGPR